MNVPSYPFHSLPLRLHLRVHKGMELNDHKRIEKNGMEWNELYLRKGKEWKRTEGNGIK